jgi:uncharacterized protein with von Willebrand factor type A (vWA) domain
MHAKHKVKVERLNLNLKDLNLSHRLKSFGIEKNEDEMLDAIEMIIEKSSNAQLISNFKSKFKTKQEFKDFILKGNMFPRETRYFNNLCQEVMVQVNSTKELNDSKSETKKTDLLLMLYEYLNIFLKLCSMKGLYSKLDFKLQTYKDDITII